jgi:hypothetical protein
LIELNFINLAKRHKRMLAPTKGLSMGSFDLAVALRKHCPGFNWHQ